MKKGKVIAFIVGILAPIKALATSAYAAAQEALALARLLTTIGTYLSDWDCATGMPISFPHAIPYTYTTGMYYTVSNVASGSGNNYIPSGSSFDGTASTVTTTEVVSPLDFFVYDGTKWIHRKLSGLLAKFLRFDTQQTLSAQEKQNIQNAIGLPEKLILSGSGEPGNTTPAVVGQLYLDTSENNLYKCASFYTYAGNEYRTWSFLKQAYILRTNVSADMRNAIIMAGEAGIMEVGSGSYHVYLPLIKRVDQTSYTYSNGEWIVVADTSSTYPSFTTKEVYGEHHIPKKKEYGTGNSTGAAAGTNTFITSTSALTISLFGRCYNTTWGVDGFFTTCDEPFVGEVARVIITPNTAITPTITAQNCTWGGATHLVDYTGDVPYKMTVGHTYIYEFTWNGSKYDLKIYDNGIRHGKEVVTIGTAAPTTTTIGEKGALYVDSNNQRVYMCTNSLPSSNSYAWNLIRTLTYVNANTAAADFGKRIPDCLFNLVSGNQNLYLPFTYMNISGTTYTYIFENSTYRVTVVVNGSSKTVTVKNNFSGKHIPNMISSGAGTTSTAAIAGTNSIVGGTGATLNIDLYARCYGNNYNSSSPSTSLCDEPFVGEIARVQIAADNAITPTITAQNCTWGGASHLVDYTGDTPYQMVVGKKYLYEFTWNGSKYDLKIYEDGRRRSEPLTTIINNGSIASLAITLPASANDADVYEHTFTASAVFTPTISGSYTGETPYATVNGRKYEYIFRWVSGGWKLCILE